MAAVGHFEFAKKMWVFFNELSKFYILLNHDMGFQHFFGKKAIDFHHTNNFAIF